ncbi:MAG: hypothetical protein Q7T85_09380, partial [Nitrosomonas sp.]|nr:hypothetical protein [Nitrosomonas sp.]
MREAKLVVLRPGRTSGIWWEISHAMKTVRPERIVIVIPFSSSEYSVFIEEFKNACGVTLPDCLSDSEEFFGVAGFVYFDSDGTPNLSSVQGGFMKALRGLTEHLIPYLAAALKPVLQRLDPRWRAPPVSAFTFGYFFYLTGLVGILVASLPLGSIDDKLKELGDRGDLEQAQKMVADDFKLYLPKRIDESTTLVNVHAEKTSL